VGWYIILHFYARIFAAESIGVFIVAKHQVQAGMNHLAIYLG
jgi:hypothetical protein